MLVSYTFKITELHYRYGCPTLIEAYVYKPLVQNHWVILYLFLSSLKCSLWLLRESLDHTRLRGVPLKFQRMFVSSTYKITGLYYTYGSVTWSAAYVGNLYFQNHWVTPNVWVPNLKFSSWLPLFSETLGYTTHMGVQPVLQPVLVSSTYKITGLHYTYRGATLSAAYVGYLYLENRWVTVQL